MGRARKKAQPDAANDVHASLVGLTPNAPDPPPGEPAPAPKKRAVRRRSGATAQAQPAIGEDVAETASRVEALGRQLREAERDLVGMLQEARAQVEALRGEREEMLRAFGSLCDQAREV